MKKETFKKKKFNLEKFEVVKLSNMRKIHGGEQGIITTTGTDSDTFSSKVCKQSALCD